MNAKQKGWFNHDEQAAKQRLHDLRVKAALSVLPAFVHVEPMRINDNAKLAFDQADAFIKESFNRENN